MTKVVIPPPGQKFVDDDGSVAAPWRQYLDVLTQSLNTATDTLSSVSALLTSVNNAASQLISVTGVTNGTTATSVSIPSGWSSVRLDIRNLQFATTNSILAVRVSTNSLTVTGGYRYVTHIVNDVTQEAIVASTGHTDFLLANSPMSTASTGGLSARLDVVKTSAPMVRVSYNGGFLNGATTPNHDQFYGGGTVQITDNSINELNLRSTGAGNSWTTGAIALYGNR